MEDVVLSCEVLFWKCTTHWKTTEAISQPLTPGVTPGWRHATRGRLRIRWDEVFFTCLGGGGLEWGDLRGQLLVYLSGRRRFTVGRSQGTATSLLVREGEV